MGNMEMMEKTKVVTTLWSIWCYGSLIFSVIFTLLFLFSHITFMSAAICYIACLTSLIAGERFVGYALEPDWLAFCYIFTYVFISGLLFGPLGGQVFEKRIDFPRILLLICAVALISIQSSLFFKRARNNKEKNLVVLWAIHGIGAIIAFYILL